MCDTYIGIYTFIPLTLSTTFSDTAAAHTTEQQKDGESGLFTDTSGTDAVLAIPEENASLEEKLPSGNGDTTSKHDDSARSIQCLKAR